MGTSRPRAIRGPLVAVSLLRRVRKDLRLLVLVAVLAGLVTGAAAVVPRLLERAAREALRSTVSAAEPSARGVVGEVLGPVRVQGGDAVAGLRTDGRTASQALPPTLSSRLGPTLALVDSIRYRLLPLPGDQPLPLPAFLTLRAHDGIEDRLDLVAGRMPRSTTPDDAPAELAEAVVEVLLTPRTAEEIGAEVGDEVLGVPDLNDPVVRRRSFDLQRPVVVRVVGLAELTPPEDDFWFGDARLHRPAQQETGSGVNLFPFAILTPEALVSLPDVQDHVPLRMEFRSLLATQELSPAEVVAVRDEVRRIEAGVASDDGVRWRTGLGRLLDDHLGRVAGARAAALVALTGVLAVALVLVALLGILLSARRREATALLRGRGASGRQLLGAQVVEAVLLTVPIGAAGLAAAAAVVPGTAPGEGLRLAAAVVVLAIASLVAGAVPDVRRPLREVLDDSEDRGPRTSLRRRTIEASTALVAIAAVVALRRRGVAVGDAEGTDPLLLLTPVLLAAAVALATVRLHRVPLRLGGLIARERRGAAFLVGLARAGRSARTGAPTAVLLIAATVAVVALALDGSVRAGQVEASWDVVGAPYRIDAPVGESLPALATGDLPGATDAARETRVVAPVIEPASVAGRVDVALVELDRYERIAAGTPAAIDVPLRVLTAAPIQIEGQAPAPVAGLVSPAWARDAGLRAGDVITLLLGDSLLDVRVLGRHPGFVDLEEDTRGFLILPITHVEAALGRPVGTSRLYVDAPATASADLAAVADGLGATIRDREASLRTVRSSPLVAVVLDVLRVAAGAALVLAGLALSTSLAVTARQRARELALLSLLGGTRRQTAVAGLAEILPGVLVAGTTGGVLGAATVVLLRRPLDLAPLTGDVSTPLELPATLIVAVVVSITLLASLLAAVSALSARRADPRTILEESSR